MAIPLLAPLVPFVPVLKVIALGSIKFVALGIGASILPIQTANFLVGMSSSTPLKHAEFRYKKGYLSEKEIEAARSVFAEMNESITNPEKYLSRKESRTFLLGVMKETSMGMKQSIVSLPGKVITLCRSMTAWFSKVLSGITKKSP